MKTENNSFEYITKVWLAALLVAPILHLLEFIFLPGHLSYGREILGMVFINIIFSVPTLILSILIAHIISRTSITESNFRIFLSIFTMITFALNLWVLADQTIYSPTVLQFLIELKYHLLLIFIFGQIFDLKIKSSIEKNIISREDILDERIY